MGGGSSKRSKKSAPAPSADTASSDTVEAKHTEAKTSEAKTSEVDLDVIAAEDAATQEVRQHWDQQLEYIQRTKICTLFSWKLCQIVGRRSTQGRCKEPANGRSKNGTHHADNTILY